MHAPQIQTDPSRSARRQNRNSTTGRGSLARGPILRIKAVERGGRQEHRPFRTTLLAGRTRDFPPVIWAAWDFNCLHRAASDPRPGTQPSDYRINWRGGAMGERPGVSISTRPDDSAKVGRTVALRIGRSFIDNPAVCPEREVRHADSSSAPLRRDRGCRTLNRHGDWGRSYGTQRADGRSGRCDQRE